MKRMLTVLICGLMVLGFVSAVLAQESVPPRPVITMLDAEDTAYEGLAGPFCWLQARNDIRCEPGPLELVPETFAAVAQGDVLTFAITSESGTPRAFSATLLDDFDADGDPLLIEFEPAEEAEYTVDIPPGQHRISLLAEYDLSEVPGDNSFVTYVFGLEVGAGAVQVTPRPSATPPVPTEDKPASTEEATAALPTISDEAVAQTATAINAFLTGTETVETTEEATAEVTEAATEEVTEAATEETTEAPATAAPSATPTLRPTNTVPPPSATPTTPAPLPTVQPSPTTGFSSVNTAPQVVVVNGRDTFGPSGVAYCYNEGGRQVCIEEPASAESRRILVTSGNTLRIDFEGSGPLTMRIGLFDSNATTELNSSGEMIGTTVALYVISGQPGNYVLAVETTWTENRSATYFFRLQIVP